MSYAAYRARQAATESPLELELRAFGFVTDGLRSANDMLSRTRALQRNHDLWLTLVVDLAEPTNALPQEVRARLISVGLWSMRYSLQAMSDPLPLQPLIDVNREIAGGLADQARARVATVAPPTPPGAPTPTATAV